MAPASNRRDGDATRSTAAEATSGSPGECRRRQPASVAMSLIVWVVPSAVNVSW